MDPICVEKIDKAQACLDVCADVENFEISTVTGFGFGNQLTACLEDTPSSGIAEYLETCCMMDTYTTVTGCETAMRDAEACLVDDLEEVKTAGSAYLGCLGTNYQANLCDFAGFCVALLTAGYGTENEYNTDFAVGSGSFLATNVASAQTCDDPNLMNFGKSVCDNVINCCEPCAEKLAPVVNVVMDKILLPAYNDNLTDCGGDTTCEAYSSSGRRNLAEMVGPTTIDVQNTELATTLATECVDALANDIVLFNETFAVSNHFDCLSKKMGKIAAEMDNRAQESSGISLSFGRITGLCMVASVLYSVVA